VNEDINFPLEVSEQLKTLNSVFSRLLIGFLKYSNLICAKQAYQANSLLPLARTLWGFCIHFVNML